MKRIVVNIDDKLHREFKTFCYSKGKTIKEIIVDFMESKTRKGGKEKTK